MRRNDDGPTVAPLIVDDMGGFHVDIEVESVHARGTRRRIQHVLVDTGSEYTWLPVAELEPLGIRPEYQRKFIAADGSVVARDTGFAILYVDGRATAEDVLFGEPGDLSLLGAHTMEGLNLLVDPAGKRLVPGGPAHGSSPRFLHRVP